MILHAKPDDMQLIQGTLFTHAQGVKQRKAKDQGLFPAPSTKGSLTSKTMTASTSASIGSAQVKSVPGLHTHPGHTANESKAKSAQKSGAQAEREKVPDYETRMKRTKVRKLEQNRFI